MRKKLPRIAAARTDSGFLKATFVDGRDVTVPLEAVQPRTGRADWSRLTIELAGAHISVPVQGGEFPEHEVPWDVIERLAVTAKVSA